MNLKFRTTFALAALLALGAALPAARAKSPYRVPVHFAWTNDAGMGTNWFVVGEHPDVGGWNPVRAAPLAWHDGNVWSADIGIQAGTNLKYKFVKRPINAYEYPDGEKTEWIGGDDLELSVPAEPDAPFDAKRIVFRCPWDPPVQIVWTTLSAPSYDAETEWHSTELRQTAPGRYEGEAGEPGTWMRFTFSGYENGEQKWYHFYGTENEDFYSPLDAFCVDAGQVFDYEPVNGISDSRIVATNVYSTADGIDGREIRICLPRCYDENTDRRYPVVYFADGQNMFSDDPRAAMGGWKADIAADREIRGGRMREAILVGVPCRTNDIPGWPGTATYARLWEYLPGTDNLMGMEQLPGLADHYADFLLNNVRPTLDTHFRTLTGRDNTAHVGSSAGGLLSFYFGVRYTNDFGLVGALSGVYNTNYIPNLRSWCGTNLASVAAPKRIWLDTGTEETAVGDEGTKLNLYESNWDALTLLLYAGHAHNKSLHFGVYHSQYGEHGYDNAGEHNEIAWAARIGDVLSFLLPVTDEVDPLLPLDISLDGTTMHFPMYGNTAYRVLSVGNATDLRNHAVSTTNWTSGVVDRPWTNASFTVENPGFYWVEGK